jgi:hypothetical protein
MHAMHAMYAIPPSKAIKDLLEGLLGRDVEVAPADPVLAGDLAGSAVAVYVDDSMTLSAVAGLDLSLAANVAAAIGLVPPGGAQACIEDRELSPMLAENVTEVCNVLTTLLSRDGGPHLRLHQMYLPGQAAPTDVAARLLAVGSRLDLAVAVNGYGSGRFSLSTA